MPKSRAIPINPEAIQQIGERIRTARALASLTRPDLEKIHKIKATTIAKWEQGTAMPSFKSIHQLVHALKAHSVFCTVEWLLYGRGQETYILDHPAPAFMHESLGQSFNQAGSEFDADVLLMQEIHNFKRLYTNGVVCLINDDAMSPQFAMGDYVGGIKLPEEQIEKAINKTCIIELADGRKKLRQVIAGRRQGFYNLCGTNMRAQMQPTIIMDVELKWVAPVIWHRFMT